MWSDNKCPICRQASQSQQTPNRRELARTEKEADRMLMRASLQSDKQMKELSKERDLAQLKLAVETAEYNKKKITVMEK
jgi:hypothetical protein